MSDSAKITRGDSGQPTIKIRDEKHRLHEVDLIEMVPLFGVLGFAVHANPWPVTADEAFVVSHVETGCRAGAGESAECAVSNANKNITVAAKRDGLSEQALIARVIGIAKRKITWANKRAEPDPVSQQPQGRPQSAATQPDRGVAKP